MNSKYKSEESKGLMGLERKMDIAILEAQLNAEILYEKWKLEFQGFRAQPAKVKKNDPTQLQPTGGGLG